MKIFRVLEISGTVNSFGLRGVILVAKDGEAWEIASNDLNLPIKGKSYGVRYYPGEAHPIFAAFWWEMPRLLPPAPAEVVAYAWKELNLEVR